MYQCLVPVIIASKNNLDFGQSNMSIDNPAIDILPFADSCSPKDDRPPDHRAVADTAAPLEDDPRTDSAALSD